MNSKWNEKNSTNYKQSFLTDYHRFFFNTFEKKNQYLFTNFNLH